MKMHMWMAACAAGLMGAGLAQADTAQLDRKWATQAVGGYLAQRGDLCLGKFDWPRDVPAAEQDNGSSDAIQLPVLERLGLVKSEELPAEPAAPTRRYSLTAKGREFYVHRKMTTVGAHDEPVDHDGDLCVGRLSLDKVVKWNPPDEVHGHTHTVVTFTYHIRPAQWTSDPQVRRVFPRVDLAIRGDGKLQQEADFQLQDGKWVSVLPGQ